MARHRKKPTVQSAALLPEDQGPTPERRKKGPIAEAFMPDEGKQVRVNKALTGIEIMYRNGTIGIEEYKAAEEFQRLFLIANHDEVKTINLNGTGGGMGADTKLDRKIDAQRKVEEMIKAVGGDRSVAGRCLRCIVGMDWTLSQMIKAHGHGAHVWRGALIAALQILANNHQLPARKNKLVAKNFDVSMS